MDFLTQQNKINSGQSIPYDVHINAKDRDVVVIGGGDTGSDCVGTAIRQGAKSVTQIEILPKPPVSRDDDNPWPYFGKVLKTSSSQEEGCERRWSLATEKFIGDRQRVSEIRINSVEWVKEGHTRPEMKIVSDSTEFLKADLVLLALGFTQPVHEGLLNDIEMKYTERQNILVSDKNQSHNVKVFAAGDSVLGASLVVRAIKSGRDAASNIDTYLISLDKL